MLVVSTTRTVREAGKDMDPAISYRRKNIFLASLPIINILYQPGEVIVNVRWGTTWPDFVERWRGIGALPIISCPGFLRFSASEIWYLKGLRIAWHSIREVTASRYGTHRYILSRLVSALDIRIAFLAEKYALAVVLKHAMIP